MQPQSRFLRNAQGSLDRRGWVRHEVFGEKVSSGQTHGGQGPCGKGLSGRGGV